MYYFIRVHFINDIFAENKSHLNTLYQGLN